MSGEGKRGSPTLYIGLAGALICDQLLLLEGKFRDIQIVIIANFVVLSIGIKRVVCIKSYVSSQRAWIHRLIWALVYCILDKGPFLY